MRAFPGNDERMSVLHQDSGGIGKSIPSALEISLGHGFCTPRPSGFPSGFALGKSLGPRGAKSPPLGNLSGLGGCISQYIPPLGNVRIQYAIVLHSIVSYCTGCTVLHGIEGYFIVLHHVASYQMVLPSIVTQYCRVIDGIVLWCMVLHVVCGML